MPPSFRPGTPEDSPRVFKVFEQSVLDLGKRLGAMAITGGRDPAVLARLWEQRRPLFEHLATNADLFWVAEQKNEIVGYARSVVRSDVRQLTELFVLPTHQSEGVGGELLTRAFPAKGAKRRVVAASIDVRAMSRYLRLGLYPRFPIFYFSRKPEVTSVKTDLQAHPIERSKESLDLFGAVDVAVLGMRREIDHDWLLQQRQGFWYRRGHQLLGYGYVGHRSGPFAVLKPSDFPAVLTHAESEAARQGLDFGVEVPMVNRAAVDHLLARGFRLESFIELFMSDTVYGKFENYIFTSPLFLM